jgi:crossover junction endodeoxyribonuclease RusA
MIALTLPMPPSINHYYGQRGNRTFIRPAGIAFRQSVADIVLDSNIQKIDGRLSLFAVLYFADRRRTDIDNRAKALQDALTHAGVYEDDCQIDDLHITRHADRIAGGLVKIVITEIS